MADGRCLPRVPFEKWAVDGGLENGDQEWENWRYLRVWAQKLLDDCLGSCDPMAVRCHVALTCAGLEYTLNTALGDYAFGGTSVNASLGLVLPEGGIWNIGFNMSVDTASGTHMGQGLFRVTNAGPHDYDYGIAVGNEDDTAFNHVSASGATDHMVPDSATVQVVQEGSSSFQFLTLGSGVLYAHRIECTSNLVTAYP